MKTFLKIFLALLISCEIIGTFFNCDSFAQSLTWQRIFGGPRNDFAYDTFQTLDGNFLMVGEKIVRSVNTRVLYFTNVFSKV